MKRFVGKVALVTASTAGIGLEIARRFAQEGAKVIISSRKPQNVQAAVEQLQNEGLDVQGVVCHVADKAQRKQLIKTAAGVGLNKIHFLVSNAAINPIAATIMDMPESAIDKILDVNLKATIMLVKETAPYLSEDAAVVILSSYAGYNPAVDTHLGMYSVSKTALIGLTKVLAKELGQKGIRVNGVAPGIIPTKLSSLLVNTPELASDYLKTTSLGRLGTVEEIAGLVSFLCSKDAGYITGETIVASGGSLSRLWMGIRSLCAYGVSKPTLNAT